MHMLLWGTTEICFTMDTTKIPGHTIKQVKFKVICIFVALNMILVMAIVPFHTSVTPRIVVKKNILLLIADDMRPAINAFLQPGADHIMHTPNLDALASRSLVLKKAFAQQAICSPSRSSFLTGRRPDTTRVYDLYRYFRKSGGNFTTIPQYFKDHGYVSIGAGKVFHPGVASGKGCDSLSWSEPCFSPKFLKQWKTLKHKKSSWVAVAKNEKKYPFPDEEVAEYAKETLKELIL